MADDSTHDGPIRIYEGASLTAKAPIPSADAEFVEEVTFKFFQDGEPFDPAIEKTGPISEATSESDSSVADAPVVIKYDVRAPTVPDDKDSYLLDYHVFYKVKNEDGTTEQHQNLSIKKFEVLPRTAQLKVTWDKDGESFHNFQFNVFQGGEQFGQTQTTFAKDTKNSKDETVPAGTAEFNLGLSPGFRIVQEGPFEITEYVVTTTRKREVKGDLKFRALFIAPKKGTIQQYVNYDVEYQGQTGIGDEVLVEVGVEGDDDRAVKIGNENTEIHFRVTYGPEDGDPVAKSKREDTDHPTKAMKASESDTTATIEEKTANTKYEGKVTLPGGIGRFKVALGLAGGDTCTVEISGSDKFLTDDKITPDATLVFENWRAVYYELMVPDTLHETALDAETQDVKRDVRQQLDTLSRQLFIEFLHADTHVFGAVRQADHGTLGPKRFFNLPNDDGNPAYVLSGRNWREVPKGQSWAEENPSKTLYISLCDRLLKWRTDTSDENAGTKDFSGTLTEAAGTVDPKERFGGLFMPFSGEDAGDGITDVVWTADISKDDSVCKYTPKLTIEEERYEDDASDTLFIALAFASTALTELVFSRPQNAEGEGDEDNTSFASELTQAHIAQMKGFINSILAMRAALAKEDGKTLVHISCPEGADHGEDDCIASVKSKLEELFNDAKADFYIHPALNPAEDFAPRTDSCLMADITDVQKSTMDEWHFRLPVQLPNDSPGPGAFVGAEKTKEKCPVKIEFSFRPHELSPGEADGKLIAWASADADSPKQLVRLILRGFDANGDNASLEHDHGDEGKPGDCLEEADVLCDTCVDYGRAKDLTAI